MNAARILAIGSLSWLLCWPGQGVGAQESARYTLVEALDPSDNEGSWIVSGTLSSRAPLSGSFEAIDADGRIPLNRVFNFKITGLAIESTPFEIEGTGGYLFADTSNVLRFSAGLYAVINGQGVSLSGSGPKRSQDIPPTVVEADLVAEGYRVHLVAVRDDRCVGDCDGDSRVSIDELISSVAIGMRSKSYRTCIPADADLNRHVTVNELVQAVDNALHGCE